MPYINLFKVRSAQNSDGSFGHSVTLTSMAIAALSGFNALDIPSVRCDPDAFNSSQFTSDRYLEGGEMTVFYRIVDSFSNGQTLVGEMKVPSGASVLDALEAYRKENPKVFW